MAYRPSINRGIWAREPLSFRGEIPVFSTPSDYTENYERISSDHLTHFRSTGKNPFIEERLWKESEESTLQLIRKYAKPGDRILDVGVGLGRVLADLPDLERHGMDISFGYLEAAAAKNIEVCYALVEDMPYRPETFDLVMATDILEHVLDLNLACTRILSVLKKAGCLVVRVPYREDLRGYLDPSYPYTYVHVRNFDEHALRLLFERVLRCEVVESLYAGYVTNGTRLKIPLPAGARLLARLLKILSRVAPGAHRKWLRRLYWPMEINVVVRKRA